MKRRQVTIPDKTLLEILEKHLDDNWTAGFSFPSDTTLKGVTYDVKMGHTTIVMQSENFNARDPIEGGEEGEAHFLQAKDVH